MELRMNNLTVAHSLLFWWTRRNQANISVYVLHGMVLLLSYIFGCFDWQSFKAIHALAACMCDYKEQMKRAVSVYLGTLTKMTVLYLCVVVFQFQHFIQSMLQQQKNSKQKKLLFVVAYQANEDTTVYTVSLLREQLSK